MQTRATGWHAERAKILHRICKGVERRRMALGSLRRAVRVPAWRWRNRTYRCDPSRPVRLSRKSLVNHFYEWQENGKTPEAFALHYRAGRKMPARLAADFLKLCGVPGIFSLAAAYRRLCELWRSGELKRPFKFRRCGEFPFRYSTVCRALTREQRRVIIQFHEAERAATRARENFRLLTNPD